MDETSKIERIHRLQLFYWVIDKSYLAHFCLDWTFNFSIRKWLKGHQKSMGKEYSRLEIMWPHAGKCLPEKLQIWIILPCGDDSTMENVSIFRVILVRIFPAFSHIQTEYGSISPYSVRMQENSGKMQTRIIPNRDIFYAVDSTKEINIHV